MSEVEFVAETPAPPSIPVPPELVSPQQRAQRLGRRSLTSRLIVGVVSLVVVLVLGVGGGTYYALRQFLNQRLTQQLKSTAGGDLNTLFGLGTQQGPPVKAPQGVWAVALDTSGRILAYPSSEAVQRLKLTAATRAALTDGTVSTTMTVSTTDGYQLLVTTRQTVATSEARGTQQQAIAVVGLSTAEEERTLHRLIALELLIGGGAVLVAVFATYGGVKFSLRGLRRVTTTAQEVAAELGPSGVALQRRVPVTEDGTEVAQLTHSMNTLLQATETQFAARVESEERMRQFLADASHELRTPLTSIRGYAELARMQRAVGREGEDNLDRIEAEGTRMSRLVEDLLMLARGDGVEADPLRVPIEVTDLVRDAASGARAAFPDRQIEMDAMLPHGILGDPDQLLRVVRNLITNAAVHTRPDGPIRVRAFADGPGVVIQVVDSGPGLPPEQAAHVFERFWRADKARMRARGGSGLGLSIVATIVQAHGGTVRFDSSVEAGSTVTVWLPSAN